MPVSCCIKNCKSTWKKNSDIKFYRFPLKNSIAMKYWIATTGRNNWSPYTDARICSLHFTDNDYYNNKGDIKRRHLKRNVIPTQNVHSNILQILQQNAHNSEMSQLKEIHEINKGNQINAIIQNKEELRNEKNEGGQRKVIENKELMNEKNDKTALAIPKCLKCDELLNEVNQLRKKVDELTKLLEERLNQQANMFHELMNKREAALKEKYEKMKNKNKTLNKNIQRKGKKITNLKTLFKDLRDKNILENDAALRL